MTGRLAALTAVLVGAGFDGQTAPQRLAEGESVEICGRVTSFSSGVPARCDASLEVNAGERPATIVVIPASARRGTPGGRELLDAEACFSGVVELAEAAVRVRVPSFAAIRVTRPASAPTFGLGATDACTAEGVNPPRVVYEAKPEYTSEAMKAQVQGVVIMDAVVDTRGRVSEVHVTRPLDPQLDQQAVKALRDWKFVPGTLEGKPVPVIVSVEMTFTLKPRR